MGEYDRMRGFGVTAPTRMAEKLSQDEGIESFLSFNTCYKETGICGTYFVATPKSVNDLIETTLDQWVWLATCECL